MQILSISIHSLSLFKFSLYIQKDNEGKYLIFASTDKKGSIGKLHRTLDEVKDQIELISGNKPIEYKKDFMKNKFESDGNLSLGKILNIPLCIIIVKYVSQKNNYYPQVFLHECFYEY